MSVSFNVLDIGNKVEELINSSRDRKAFVEDARDKVYYELQKKFNILVVNRQKDKHWDKPAEGEALYRSFNYKGTTYGIWAFERGVFRYFGDNGNGAPKNLAYAGNCKVSLDETAGRKSKILRFELPEEAKLHKVVKGDTLYNLAQIYKTTVEDIARLNPDKIQDVNVIRPPDILRVREW